MGDGFGWVVIDIECVCEFEVSGVVVLVEM